MKFGSGCLFGIVFGFLAAVVIFLGSSLLNNPENLQLFPAAGVGDADMTVTIQQPYLNDQLRKGAATRGMNVSDLSVALHSPNRAEATMSTSVDLLGQSYTLRPHVTFHFGVADGLVSITVDKVDVSGFSVPQDIVNQEMGSFKQYAEDQINSELKRGLGNSGLHVVGIESTEGALTIKLSR